MLGIVPVVAAFFGLPLDVRHVTLSTGQLAAAVGAAGLRRCCARAVVLVVRGRHRGHRRC